MSIYSDHDQRLLDQQTGEEMDRQAQRRERRLARDTIATAPIGPAHVFADADNNGLNARVLPAALTSNEQVEQLISEYQLAIDVRSHHTPLGRIDRIKQRCEETIAAQRELQERRAEVEKYKAWAASCDPTPPETPDVELRALREHIAWAWSIIASAGGGDWNKESADWREAAGKWERARNPYDGLEGSSPKTSCALGIESHRGCDCRTDPGIRTIAKEPQ